MALTSEFTLREKDLLRDLNDNQLLLQKGKVEGINPEAEAIKQLDSIRKSMNSAEPWKRLSRTSCRQPRPGLEDYKASMKNQMITRQVVQREVGSRLQTNKEEIQKFYDDHKKDMEHPEQVYLRQIVIATAGKQGEALDAAKKRPTTCSPEARKGEDFGMLAQKEVRR